MGSSKESADYKEDMKKLASLRRERDKNIQVAKDEFNKGNRTLASITVGNRRFDAAEALNRQIKSLCTKHGLPREQMPVKLADIMNPCTNQAQKTPTKSSSP